MEKGEVFESRRALSRRSRLEAPTVTVQTPDEQRPR
jgi:hypothetical protein